MRKLSLTVVAILLFVSCNRQQSQKDPAAYVDTFIGTGGHGHTYPGAATPFGMVQLSPDTGTQGWDWCSGYHTSDSSIMGFSHTHLSGTGGSDLGDILIMPANGNLILTPGTKEIPDEGYRSRFDHATEKSEPGYYSVELADYNILAELTATPRTGLHRYKFGSNEPQHVVIDLNHGIADLTRESYYRIVDSVTIEGYRRSRGWADDHTVYFQARFNQPFNAVEIMIDGVSTQEKQGRGTWVTLAAMYNEPIKELEIQVGISITSQQGASANLAAESTTFDAARKAAYDNWNAELSRIKVEGNSDEDKTIFYTSLYHTMLAPVLMSDVDGGYATADGGVAKDSTITAYGLFSLWDTFRALHPLFTIIEPERNAKFVRSIIRYYDQTGRLPVWDLNMNETNCMIGYHAIPVIADAYLKGQRDFDADKALEAMVASAMQNDWGGLPYYRSYKYLPSDKEQNSVSKALEYAYDDWCIAQMAQAMGRDSIYRVFNERAQYYKNHFDKSDKFFKGRSSSGEFNQSFNPTAVSLWGSGDFTEGNAWQYNFFVPQDINTHVDMCGGDEAYVAKLDEMFSTVGVEGHVSDVTGLIGQYAHGNEPSHHVAYLYNYAGQPWKTQERLAQIFKEMYTTSRDGICGNEDCGQMSAWYVMSALGFYSVTPASGIYVLGAPRFEKATVELSEGKQLVIKAKNLSPKNIYIRSIEYDGQPYLKSYITHQMIADGGELIFQMSSSPNKTFGAEPQNRPVSRIADGALSSEQMLQGVVFEPSLAEPKRTFRDYITLHPTANNKIYYTINGTEPSVNSSTVASDGIRVENSCVVKMVAIANDGRKSGVSQTQFYKSKTPQGAIIKGTEPSKPYVANGLGSLIDGLMGGANYRNPAWIGFEGVSAEIVIELPSKELINSVSVNVMNKPNEWIMPPYSIEVRTEKKATPKTLNIVTRDYEPDGAKLYTVPVNAQTDRIYITLDGGLLPDWHVNGGNKQWIFVDEIILN